MAGETILVVDDAALNLKLTNILLRKEGYQVITATDAEQALAILVSLRPDLILIDIQLPGMDGLELTRRLKQDSGTRDIVVVALILVIPIDHINSAILIIEKVEHLRPGIVEVEKVRPMMADIT